MNKPTAEEIFNLRKKMGELYGPERADELWFGWLHKNDKIVSELKKLLGDKNES